MTPETAVGFLLGEVIEVGGDRGPAVTQGVDDQQDPEKPGHDDERDDAGTTRLPAAHLSARRTWGVVEIRSVASTLP